MTFARSIPILLVLGMCGKSNSAEPIVAISTDFPGGNVTVVRNDGATVELSPDLRGGRNWFYWCFEATAIHAGKVTFKFPEKVAGFRNGAVGFQGPAVSEDGGKSWRWRGSNEQLTSADNFSWAFTKPGQQVRLAVTIPYTQANFDAFAKQYQQNPHFRLSTLTRTRSGRKVELVQVGKPGDGRRAVLMTCRHHACETIASFLLEGIMSTAVSDTETGRKFREHFVLYIVPFVDKDGVEDGDQGKNRAPHDHNRDYGEGSIYRSVQAIKMLGVEKKINALLDLHCPTLVMDIHQRFYFVGPRDAPANNEAIVEQFATQIKTNLPKKAPHGPVVLLKPTDKNRHKHCSGYFSQLDGVVMSVTLETPFAPKETKMSPDDVRDYGAAVLHAWNETDFGDR